MWICACEAAAAEADAQRQHLADAQTEIGRLTAFWHYFKRRRCQKSLESLRHQVEVADAAVGDLHAERSAVDREAAGEFPGISLAARRNINLAIISFAELLCEHVDSYGLAARAKEAVARRVHEMSFGTRADCESYMQRVQQAQATVAAQKQASAALKAKWDRLRANCEYRNNADTVPTADSLAPAPPQPAPLGTSWPTTTGTCIRCCCASARASADRCAAPGSVPPDARPRPRDPPRSATLHRAGSPRLRRP